MYSKLKSNKVKIDQTPAIQKEKNNLDYRKKKCKGKKKFGSLNMNKTRRKKCIVRVNKKWIYPATTICLPVNEVGFFYVHIILKHTMLHNVGRGIGLGLSYATKNNTFPC